MLYDSAFVNYTVLINSAIMATKTGYFFFPGLYYPAGPMFNYVDRVLHPASLSSPHVRTL